MTTNRIDLLKKFLEEEPDDIFSNYALGMEYMGISDHGSAILQFQGILDKKPDYLAAYYQLGNCYELCGRLRDAADSYRKGMQVAQQQGNMKTLGELRTALEQMEEE